MMKYLLSFLLLALSTNFAQAAPSTAAFVTPDRGTTEYNAVGPVEPYEQNLITSFLGEINNVLCEIDAFRTEEFVGQTYKGRTDSTFCNPSAGITAPTIFVVRTNRADNVSPQLTDFWLTGSVVGTGRLEATSSEEFVFNFASGDREIKIDITPSSGVVELDDSSDVSGFAFAVDYNDEIGQISLRGNDPLTVNYAYNENFFLFEEVGGADRTICLDRSPAGIIDIATKYRLYNENDGSEVKLTTGIAFTFGSNQHGYISSRGIWTSDNTTPTAGVRISDGANIVITYSGGNVASVTSGSDSVEFASPLELAVNYEAGDKRVNVPNEGRNPDVGNREMTYFGDGDLALDGGTYETTSYSANIDIPPFNFKDGTQLTERGGGTGTYVIKATEISLFPNVRPSAVNCGGLTTNSAFTPRTARGLTITEDSRLDVPGAERVINGEVQ